MCLKLSAMPENRVTFFYLWPLNSIFFLSNKINMSLKQLLMIASKNGQEADLMRFSMNMDLTLLKEKEKILRISYVCYLAKMLDLSSRLREHCVGSKHCTTKLKIGDRNCM